MSDIQLQLRDKLRGIGLTDKLGTFAPSSPVFSDTVTLSEVVTLLEAGFVNNPIEGIGLSDSLFQPNLNFLICVKEDNYVGSDAVACDQLVTGVTLIWITDNVDNVIVGISLPLSDILSLSDAASLAGPGITLGFTDSVTLSDANIIVTGVVANFTESLTISDTVDSAAPDSLGISDTLALSDAISVDAGTGAIALTMANTITFSDSDTVVLGENESFSDTLAFSDLSAALERGFLSTSDQLVLSDILQVKAPISGLDLSDSLLFTEEVDIKYGILEGSSLDALGLSDAVSLFLLVVDPQVSDSYALNDSTQVHLDTASLRLADTLVLSDLTVVQLSSNILRTVSDSYSLSDAAQAISYTDFIDYVRRYLNDVSGVSNVGS